MEAPLALFTASLAFPTSLAPFLPMKKSTKRVREEKGKGAFDAPVIKRDKEADQWHHYVEGH